MNKSYFANETDFSFFGDDALTKLLIYFDCLFEGQWKGKDTKVSDSTIENLNILRKNGYSLFLIEVPLNEEVLEWLDETFSYPFTCNDYPYRYADTGDHWTTISRSGNTHLCPQGNSSYNRYIRFDGNWSDICSIIMENDLIAQMKD